MSQDETTGEETTRLRRELEAALRDVEDQRERADAAERRIALVESERDDARARIGDRCRPQLPRGGKHRRACHR